MFLIPPTTTRSWRVLWTLLYKLAQSLVNLYYEFTQEASREGIVSPSAVPTVGRQILRCHRLRVQRTESNGAETDGWAWNPAPAAVSGLHRPGFFSITHRITGQLWAHKKSNSVRARETLVGNSNSALCPSVKWILPTPWDDGDDYHGQQKERLAQAWISRDSFVLWTRDCLSSFPAPMLWFCYVIKNSLDKWEPRNYSLDNGLMV